MLYVLMRLHNLWYIIFILSSSVLIATVVLLSLNLSYLPTLGLVVPLLASITTVALFAYGLWGKSNPFLMPTSSPRSNPCTRSVRHFGTFLLSLFWIISTVIFITTQVTIGKVFAGLTLLIMILVVVESISSNRIGKEQRRILKEEERKMDLSMITTVSDSTLVGGAGLSSLRKGKKHGNNASRDSELNNDNSSINSGTDNTSVTTVEIVRPEPLDPAAVIYSQQVLYDLAQRQYRQQYEQYTLQQQQSQSRGNGSSNGDTHLEEGKYDDILLESSYKFEVPMDEPLSNDSTDPSALPLSTSPSGEKLHLPSAPPAPAHPSSHSTYPIPSKAPVSLTTTSYPSSSSATNPQKQQQQRMSLLKSDISPVGIQIMTETNPYRDEDYRSLAELSASAPPYEPSSPSLSFQGVVMMPVPSSSLSQVVTSVPETLSYDNVHIDSSKTIPPTTTVETTSTTVTSGVKHDHA